MTLHEKLIHKIETKQAVIGVIGLGCVGLPLMLSFVEHQFRCIGFDADAKTIKALLRGESPVSHVLSKRILAAIESGLFSVRSYLTLVWECDVIVLATPTSAGKKGGPDLRYIVGATEAVAPFMRRGKLIVVESSTYPAMLDDVVVPILERGGLKAGVDFFAAFSAGVTDPPNAGDPFRAPPKIIGATSPEGLAVAEKLYHQVELNLVAVATDYVVGMQ
jgi:UDP-N-acetyl-D-glucosamine dehydrogenase